MLPFLGALAIASHPCCLMPNVPHKLKVQYCCIATPAAGLHLMLLTDLVCVFLGGLVEADTGRVVLAAVEGATIRLDFVGAWARRCYTGRPGPLCAVTKAAPRVNQNAQGSNAHLCKLPSTHTNVSPNLVTCKCLLYKITCSGS